MASPIGPPPVRTVATTRGGRLEAATAAEASSPAASASVARLRARMGLLALAQRVEVGVAAEEQLEQQSVPRDAGDRFWRVEPGAERPFARARDFVELLIGPLLLRDDHRLSKSPFDEPRQDRVDLALGGAPEVADAAPRQLVEVVTGPL